VNTALATRARLWPTLVDLVALTKPRVSSLVIATAAVGMGVAPGSIALGPAIAMLAATVVLVGSANALNCWLERDTDAFMRRTASRPLPAGRLDPLLGVVFGVALAVVSLPLLYLQVNALTAGLGLLAILSYVGLYTPLKFRSPAAMVVGAVPGALPPLMGWTAVTGELALGGLLLFGVVFLWQMPHVIGLSTYRRGEYAAAGIRVLPLVRGARVAQHHALAWALCLLPVSVALWACGYGGTFYLVGAVALSLVYALSAAHYLWMPERSADRWGRALFLASLLYLPLLFLALLVDLG